LPAMVRRDDTLYVYYGNADTVPDNGIYLIRYHFDSDIWDERVLIVPEGGPGPRWPDPFHYRNTDFPVEVSVILDEEDQIVMFYRLAYGHEQTGVGGPQFQEYIRSATEIEGSDGTEFTVDEGNRLTFEANRNFPDTAVNPDVLG